MLLKFQKERFKEHFRLKSLYSDGFLYGVVLKNIDKCVLKWKNWFVTQPSSGSPDRRAPSSHVVWTSSLSRHSFWLKKNHLESCLMNVGLMFTLFAPFVSRPALLLRREYTGALPELTVLCWNMTQNEFTLWTTLVYMWFDLMLV